MWEMKAKFARASCRERNDIVAMREEIVIGGVMSIDGSMNWLFAAAYASIFCAATTTHAQSNGLCPLA